ncbi:hypothetical protein [Streptomyces reticuli]|uniref:Uncharacterized protein n=1 Tax=Streptomyces bangladeshensis TaxID=295352 RepID=A0ABN3BHP9_9ACTN|nr:hypothetical protein EASAB2608_05646 [Streptomyces sp. EAS-AB2608]
MSALTGYSPPSTRDTVDADTLARKATSRMVLRAAPPPFLVIPSPFPPPWHMPSATASPAPGG